VRVVEEPLAGGIICVEVEGRLDAATVPVLEKALQHLLADAQYHLIVDMNAVSYVSSSGLRALLAARRQARSWGGDVYLCQLSARVREILEMVGFLSVFGVYATREEARGAFPQSASFM
jgi:anti-sigma B factor antagonist